MKTQVKIWIIFIGLIIGGIAYWFQPYKELAAPLGIHVYLIWCLGAFWGALFLMVYLNKSPSLISLFLTLGIVLAVLARIIYDTTFWDSTSHNLAPFEIFYCGVITVPCAFAGSFLVVAIKKIIK